MNKTEAYLQTNAFFCDGELLESVPEGRFYKETCYTKERYSCYLVMFHNHSVKQTFTPLGLPAVKNTFFSGCEP